MEPTPMSLKLRVLILEDMPTDAELAEYELRKASIDFTSLRVETRDTFIKALKEFRPDIILSDYKLPDFNGMDALKIVQSDHSEVPMIMVTGALTDIEAVELIQAGAKDYVLKDRLARLVPAVKRTLAAEQVSRAHKAAETALLEANHKLLSYHEASEYALDMAKALMEHMVQESSTPVSGVELWLQPATNMSGDLVITQKYCNERDYVLLADARGHGLPAALPLVPLVQVFSAMSRQGFTVPAIIREMNIRLKLLLPVGNFVAVTLLSIDRANRMLEIWNGGNPAALLLNEEGNPTRQFQSRHPAVGILRGDNFDASTELYQWNKEGWLVCYSDGLSEATNAQAEDFGTERIIASLHGNTPFHSLKQAVTDHLDGYAAHDDISLAIVALQ